jgi:hypothetical protein
VQGETDLFDVVGAGAATSSLTSGLHGGQQQTDQRANDGNDDEQFDEREATSLQCPGITARLQERYKAHRRLLKNTKTKKSNVSGRPEALRLSDENIVCMKTVEPHLQDDVFKTTSLG